MKNIKSQWFWVIIVICFIVILFIVFPIWVLPILLKNLYGIDNANTANGIMQNYALVGDSYGAYNALFSALAFGGVIATLIFQQRDAKKTSLINRFYKMLDYQVKLIEDMSVFPVKKSGAGKNENAVTGRKVFIGYKMQIKYLLRAIAEISEENSLELSESDIADIAYAVFYYGAGAIRKDFMLEYLKDYTEKEKIVGYILAKLESSKYARYALGRANQNYLSVYFRNMYNTIKIIDSAKLLSQDEKRGYIKILRAQLSNAELYVLFFNLLSRFGRKWIAKDYVTKYDIIQNLPTQYCDGYNPKDYFGTIKYESDEKTLSTFHEVMRPRV